MNQLEKEIPGVSGVHMMMFDPEYGVFPEVVMRLRSESDVPEKEKENV